MMFCNFLPHRRTLARIAHQLPPRHFMSTLTQLVTAAILLPALTPSGCHTKGAAFPIPRSQTIRRRNPPHTPSKSTTTRIRFLTQSAFCCLSPFLPYVYEQGRDSVVC